MLVIRDAQLQALELGIQIRTLVESHPEQRIALGRQGFRDRVLGAMQRADELGISEPGDQRRFAALSLELGPGFPDDREWATTILAWPEDGPVRVTALEQRLVQEKIKAFQAGEDA